jgi:spore coat polysaccharide biosynthesis protein SpsF
MLARVVRRTATADGLDDVVVATTSNPADDAVVQTCIQNGWHYFRGSENDVLDRYYHAAEKFLAEIVIRVTADCPLIDPGVINRVMQAFFQAKPDYASNTLKRTYPRGLDVEVMTSKCLTRAWREAIEPWQRAHVTPYIYNNSKGFHILSVTGESDYSCHRWTVDTPDDLAFVNAVYARLSDPEDFSWNDVVSILSREPELAEMNRGVAQKAPTDY